MHSPLKLADPANVHNWYNAARAWYTAVPPILSLASFVIDAPFGRFTPNSDSIFIVDGIKSWIVMELVSPISFVYAYLIRPLGPTLTPGRTLLAALFLVHYANRAVISPLRTPSRSKSHIVVPLFAVAFNLVNGTLNGTYLASPSPPPPTLVYYFGIALWAAGFVGNIVHDEILLNIRRKARVKKEKEEISGEKKGEHYAIPHGMLYKYVSYPNYLCEWVEWLGFAVASGPLPSLSLATLSLPAIKGCLLSPSTCTSFAPGLTPPWLFFIAEICTMLPRAYKGHKWYHSRFKDYPKERAAVIPGLL